MTHFVGFKFRGYSIFFHYSYKKLPLVPRNLSHPQYVAQCFVVYNILLTLTVSKHLY